jgi:hypothetical protein
LSDLDTDARKSFLVIFRKLTFDGEVISLEKIYRD